MRGAALTALMLACATSTAAAQGSLERAHGRLIVEVSGDTDGVQVLVDGLLLSRDRWGRPTRVELGRHVVEARRDGQVVSSAETVVPRGGDAHVELEVAPPRAVSEGPLRIEPASRPSSMGGSDQGGRAGGDGDRYAATSDPLDDDAPPEGFDEDEAAQPVGYREEDDGDGFTIPTWAWWAAGGVALGVLLIVVIAVAASSSGPPVEGDLMPGVIRF